MIEPWTMEEKALMHYRAWLSSQYGSRPVSDMEVPTNQRGHSFMPEVVHVGIHYSLRDAHREHLEKLFSDMTKEKLDEFVSLKSSLSMYHECGYCGENPNIILEEIDGKPVRVSATTECAAAVGIENVFYLDVPSGKIVVDDVLRPVYDFDISDLKHDYNGHLGQAEMSQEMAKLGCAYGFTSNTSPGLYQTGVGQYVIASPAYDEETDHEEAPGQLIASICTDVWAYSIADHDDWVSKGGQLYGDYRDPEIVDFPAGRYKFTHRSGLRGFQWDSAGEVIFATIERVSDV